MRRKQNKVRPANGGAKVKRPRAGSLLHHHVVDEPHPAEVGGQAQHHGPAGRVGCQRLQGEGVGQATYSGAMRGSRARAASASACTRAGGTFWRTCAAAVASTRCSSGAAARAAASSRRLREDIASPSASRMVGQATISRSNDKSATNWRSTATCCQSFCPKYARCGRAR